MTKQEIKAAIAAAESQLDATRKEIADFQAFSKGEGSTRRDLEERIRIARQRHGDAQAAGDDSAIKAAKSEIEKARKALDDFEDKVGGMRRRYSAARSSEGRLTGEIGRLSSWLAAYDAYEIAESANAIAQELADAYGRIAETMRKAGIEIDLPPVCAFDNHGGQLTKRILFMNGLGEI